MVNHFTLAFFSLAVVLPFIAHRRSRTSGERFGPWLLRIAR
jgi:hypothetical protein